MKSDAGQRGDVWEYYETPNSPLTAAVVFGVIVSGIAALFAGNGIMEKISFVVLFVFMVLLLMWFAKKSTTVVISIKDAVIYKDERSVIFRKCLTYPLGDFTGISLKEKVGSGEEGFLTADYSLVLEGREHSLTILSTYDREEAVGYQKELREYLEVDGRAALRRPATDTPW
jgi:hypothetical protein